MLLTLESLYTYCRPQTFVLSLLGMIWNGKVGSLHICHCDIEYVHVESLDEAIAYLLTPGMLCCSSMILEVFIR
jgi:hypothetical protein